MKLYQHPNYNSNTMENDIALLILGDPASSDGTYVPQFIQVNRDPAYPVVNQTVTAAGWGTTSSGGSISQNLLEVNLQAISTQHCMTFVGAYGSYGSEANYATGICAGTGNGTDTCQGDSGGPLFASRNGVYVQVGITSWGWGCATYPGLYSRVSALSGWIDGVVNGEGGYAGQTSQSTKTATTTRTQTPVTTTTQTTQTFSTTTICATSEAQIPDLNFASSQVLVPADFPAVQHINVIVTFNHTYPRDMTASLLRTSDDRSIRLFSRMACTSPHAWTMTFDDHAEISTFDCSAWDDQPTIRPLDALSTFSGANAAGAWKLTMRDELPADAGYLTSWCMVLSGTPGEYPTTVSFQRRE